MKKYRKIIKKILLLVLLFCCMPKTDYSRTIESTYTINNNIGISSTVQGINIGNINTKIIGSDNNSIKAKRLYCASRNKFAIKCNHNYAKYS